MLGSSKSKPTTVDISISNQVCQYAQMFDLYFLDLTNTLDMGISIYDQYGYQSTTIFEAGEMNKFTLVSSDAIEYIELDPVLEDVGRTVQFVVGPNVTDTVVSTHVLDEGYQEWEIQQTAIVNALTETGTQACELRYLSYPKRVVSFTITVSTSLSGIKPSRLVSCPVTLNYMNADGKSVTVSSVTDSTGVAAILRTDVAKVNMAVVATATPTPPTLYKKGTTSLDINDSVHSVEIEVICDLK